MINTMTAEYGMQNATLSTENNTSIAPKKQTYSVSDLNQLVSRTLAQQFPLLWVRGEVSSFTRASSGHWYFSLKDRRAQVRCVMFRGQNQYLDWQPVEGDEIEARCNVTLYEARGDYQLSIEFIQRAGLGSLFEAFETLKKQLASEGVFDEHLKKSLPAFPRRIGIVTSKDAAALSDVLSTLRRRMPNVPVIIYPTPVQGRGAASTIANQITIANERKECDVLIVCRGGGSLEDLWQFNEAVVARSIAASEIPIVSGVGHETDFTICDFAADCRAATPTAAAELVTQSQVALKQQVSQNQQRLNQLMKAELNQLSLNLDYAAKRLISPEQRIKEQKTSLTRLKQRLHYAVNQRLALQQQQIKRLEQSLKHLNPSAVLTRGYAIVENTDGEVIANASTLQSDQAVSITFAQGKADATIKKIRD